MRRMRAPRPRPRVASPMASQAALEADPSQRGGWRSRVRGAFSGSREGIRLAYRDPEHASERLTQLGVARLAGPWKRDTHEPIIGQKAAFMSFLRPVMHW